MARVLCTHVSCCLSLSSLNHTHIQADVITRENGIVASVASDWTLGEAAFPLSLVFMTLGFSAAGLGPWQQKVGVRKALLTGSFAFGGGLGLASLGIHYHMLPLVYGGYGCKLTCDWMHVCDVM